MPQNTPRGAPDAVRRRVVMPAADRAAATVSPSTASIGWPSNVKETDRPTGRMEAWVRRMADTMPRARRGSQPALTLAV